jgi:hypothetical protein
VVSQLRDPVRSNHTIKQHLAMSGGQLRDPRYDQPRRGRTLLHAPGHNQPWSGKLLLHDPGHDQPSAAGWRMTWYAWSASIGFCKTLIKLLANYYLILIKTP